MTDETKQPAPSFDITSWFVREQEFVKRCESIRTPNKTVLFDVLAKVGITVVIVYFDGYGDSGQIEEINARAGDRAAELPSLALEIACAEWHSVEITRVTLAIDGVIEQLAYDCLREIHWGWENNEGAFGEFTFDVAERSITLDYNERIERSDHTQHVF